ncbi:hypothetical protein CC78DRAFT_534774 [Lojkania enalia]|uniref:polynucleotide adenylyltransferase n=1 Tax=Lojkania enalia TaxID=147567 RepID=A0A9P4KAG3_9PLEO|nr:hypothetical protein CC78DRAFT_534774 [Didymosphaeria enalia]
MDQGQPQKPEELEDWLRRMITSNVANASGHAHHQTNAPSPQPQKQHSPRAQNQSSENRSPRSFHSASRNIHGNLQPLSRPNVPPKPPPQGNDASTKNQSTRSFHSAGRNVYDNPQPISRPKLPPKSPPHQFGVPSTISDRMAETQLQQGTPNLPLKPPPQFNYPSTKSSGMAEMQRQRGPSTRGHSNNSQRSHPLPHRTQHRQAYNQPNTTSTEQNSTILQRPLNPSNPIAKYLVSPVAQNVPPQSVYNIQSPGDPFAQSKHLDQLAALKVPKVEITPVELEEKEAFRKELEQICKDALAKGYTGDIETVNLVGYGSLASGFATSGSDMDLALVPVWKDLARSEDEIPKEIPRLLEKAMLDAKMGGRLLTRTRVPILKVCQSPTEELYQALSDERKKWDELSEEEKYPAPTPPSVKTEKPIIEVNERKPDLTNTLNTPKSPSTSQPNPETLKELTSKRHLTDASTDASEPTTLQRAPKDLKPPSEKPWIREKALGPLDFPKTGVGIQCDINFGNLLGLYNTRLLRCYSLCDPRVRFIVLFIKTWAKTRKINSAYSGTLSSYGYVLMVLHYLINIAWPPVLPNLQQAALVSNPVIRNGSVDKKVQGWSVVFWADEGQIQRDAQAGRLTRNTQSVGELLCGFFQYFANLNQSYKFGPRPPMFHWVTEVLCLRQPGGVRSKQEKGWTAARTTVVGGKEVRHRFLFAIEDPFEWEHNVARTVTHNGIVAIRDEFRRAWRILEAIGHGMTPEGGLFDEVVIEVKREEVQTKIGTTETMASADADEAKHKVKGKVTSEAKSEAKGEAKNEVKSEVKGEAKSEVKSGVKHGATAEVKDELRIELKSKDKEEIEDTGTNVDTAKTQPNKNP